MQHVESSASTPLIGFCNGDLLFSSSFVRALAFLLDKMHRNELLSKVLAFLFGLFVDSHRGAARQREFPRRSGVSLRILEAGRVYRVAGAQRIAFPGRRGGFLYLHEGNVQLERAREHGDRQARIRQLLSELRVLSSPNDFVRGRDQCG